MVTALAVAPSRATLGATAPTPPDLRYFRIGTGTTGGTYFPIGGLLASAISGPHGGSRCELGGSCGVPGLIAVAQASSGSVENITNLRDERIDSVLSQSDIAFWAYTATEIYADRPPFEGIRAIAHLYNELMHVIVPAESAFQTVADLRGRRVAIGEQGSGTLIEARLVLRAYGLSEDEIRPFYLRPEAAADRMLAGDLDAFMFIGGVPLLAVQDLARRMPIRLLPFADEATDRLLHDMPFFLEVDLGRDTYPGVAPVPMLAVGAAWFTHESQDEAIIYGITRALWQPSTLTLLRNGHPRGAEIRLENAVRGIPVPFHAGAQRYYREIGLLNAAGAEER